MRTRGLAVAVAFIWTLAAAHVAFAEDAPTPNAYGQVFVGQEKCLECHGGTSGKWQVGTYGDTAHGRMVTDVQVSTSSIAPAPAKWPSPTLAGGLSANPADIWLQVGAPGNLHEYVSVFKNDATHTFSTGSLCPTVAGPADDRLMLNGITFDSLTNAWTVEGVVQPRTYFQGCGGCHNLGVTRPSDTTYTLANGGTMSHSTETSYAALGIQCETCHGTGKAGNGHWNVGVEVVRTKQALKSQTCGQCHVNGTAKEKNYVGKTFSNPNGFTADRKLSDFFDVAGTQYVKTSPAAEPSIPGTETKFFPDGHNKGMHHSYYNEWMLSGHARSLKYEDGQYWSATPKAECLACHSGEGYLKRIGYGAYGPNDIGAEPSSLASDTLNVECGVCHTVHSRTGDALGLRLSKEDLCSSCHNASIRPGAEATPGVTLHHPDREMLAGYGLIGVPKRTKAFMTDATCVDCHMPVTYQNRVSHRFTPMLPGNAAAWGVQAGGDSCTPCHGGRSRTALQADIDGWQSDIAAGTRDASAAIAAAAARPTATTSWGRVLIASARTNVSFVAADGSHGVHDYPYARAGLDKAVYFAKAVGARFTRFETTAYDTRQGMAMAVGTLAYGDGSAASGQSVTIEALTAGTSAWRVAGTAQTDAAGQFVAALSPTATTRYRLRWTAKDASTAITSGERTVVRASTTSARLSAATVVRGGTIRVYGSVAPANPGGSVTIQYHYGSYSWRTLGIARIDTRGAYSFAWRTTTRGSWYFRVLYGGDAGHTASSSGVLGLRVN